MPDDLGLLVRRIDRSRMRELLVDFANLQRASEQGVAAAEWFAGLLRASGAVEARVLERNLHGPVAVAGFPGIRRGPTLQFMGYFAGPTNAPRKAFAADGHVYGPVVASGAAGLIAAAEAARVLAAYGPMPGGGLLFTARPLTDQAEAAADISRLIDSGIAGQAVVITSGPSTILPVTGQGTCRFEVRFTIPDAGLPLFEGRSSAIDAAHAFCRAIRRHHIAAVGAAPGGAGAETVIVGNVGGGDRFDSPARSSWLKGAWRYGFGRTAADVRSDLERLARRVAAACGARATVAVELLRAPYRLDAISSPAADLSAAYRAVWGSDLPVGADTLPSDVPLFLERGISAVCHGPRSAAGRSGDEECVSVEDMARLAEVYARLSLHYLHHETKSMGGKYGSDDVKEPGDKVAKDGVAPSASQVFAI